MKVLIFIFAINGGGAERVTVNLANHWTAQGWEVTIVSMVSSGEDAYELDAAVKRIVLGLTGKSGNPLTALLQNIRRVTALRRALQDIAPDIALAMESRANVILALAASGLPNIFALGSERTFPPRSPLGLVWRTMRRFTYGRLTAVVALTQECAAWLNAHSAARRVPVIPNAVCWPVPVHAPTIAPAAVCRPQRRRLLAVGRLYKEKNFDVMIDVFSRLARKHPDWDLVILGEGPERKALEAQVDTSSGKGCVFLPGRVGNVGDWYEYADLYVLTSRFEGFPNTLAEALSYGVPAVSFDCDTGPRDILRHGVDGLLVRAGDRPGLQAALDQLMSNPSLRADFGKRAAEARERFSIQKISSMWKELFDECAREHRRGGDASAKRRKMLRGAANEP